MKIFNSVPLLMPLLTSECPDRRFWKCHGTESKHCGGSTHGQSCVRKAEMAKVVVEVTFHAEESIVLQGVP